jgi:AraC-like DNA-binding protein
MPASHPTAAARADDVRQHFADLARTRVSFRIGSYRAEMLYWGVIGARYWRNWMHAHSYIEVCYAYRGRGTFRILDTERRVRAGDVFLAKPREHHEVVSSRSSPLGVYFWAYSLSQTAARSLAPSEDALDALLGAFLTGGEAVGRVGRNYERTLLMLCEEMMRAEPGYLKAVEPLSFKLVLDTARAVTDTSRIFQPVAPPPRAPGAASETAQIIVRYLQDNFSRRTEVRDVASQVHLSERHVSRLFRQATGTSILDYLTRLRMETAARMLLENELSIKQIARAVGYPDAHYFTTLFGRWMKTTPAAYRRNAGTGSSDGSSAVARSAGSA